MSEDITRSGEVYFIQERDFLTGEMSPYTKIGLVRDDRASSDRKSDHQTGNPRELVLHAAIPVSMVQTVEKNLHWHFARRRVTGEWFVLNSVELLEATNKCKSLGDEFSRYVSSIRRAQEFGELESSSDLLKATEVAAEWHRLQQISAVILKRSEVVLDRYKELMPKKTQMIDSFNEDGFKSKYPGIWAAYLSPPEVGGTFRLSKLDVSSLETKDEIATATQNAKDFEESIAMCEKSLRSLDDLSIDYLRFLSLTRYHETLEEIAKFHLKEICGPSGGIEGICTWKRELKPAKLDRQALKDAEPTKFGEFVTKVSREVTDTSRLAKSRAAQ